MFAAFVKKDTWWSIRLVNSVAMYHSARNAQHLTFVHNAKPTQLLKMELLSTWLLTLDNVSCATIPTASRVKATLHAVLASILPLLYHPKDCASFVLTLTASHALLTVLMFASTASTTYTLSTKQQANARHQINAQALQIASLVVVSQVAWSVTSV